MKKIIPHLCIILTLMMITLFILNYLNPLMGFLSRGMSKVVIVLWILSIIAAVACIIASLATKKSIDDQNVSLKEQELWSM